jgi:hypothetical protein
VGSRSDPALVDLVTAATSEDAENGEAAESPANDTD